MGQARANVQDGIHVRKYLHSGESIPLKLILLLQEKECTLNRKYRALPWEKLPSFIEKTRFQKRLGVQKSKQDNTKLSTLKNYYWSASS